MTLLAVERMKLFSTRSPWWCMFLALALPIGFTALIAAVSDGMSLSTTQFGYQFGLMVTLVLAALAITTEYRFGTIRATFQAVPNRTAVLLAKTAVVAVLALIIGEIGAFGSWAISTVLQPSSDLAITTAEQWREIAGVGPVFAFSAILAVGVGMLVRQTAGAVTILLLWSLMVESLIALVPEVGQDIQRWMPFVMADHFLKGGVNTAVDMPLGPWGALAYFAAVTVGVWLIGLAVTHRRDA
ncbi:ABC transporter permease [Saccharopolyspora sp. NPDC049357]|uniref:ABC transporter permease n=1 Tax=Saccharopolyspora sp. NPDC049357 TaxID=3154507 RepID=UPI00342E9C7A